jgi:hypothetical protein
MNDLGELVEAGDMNALLRAVDGLCARRSWDELLDLADMCEDAVERGKQLWPIAAHIDYRIALGAPGEYAAGVLEPKAARFAHGPLTEVAASTHTWGELAPHIEAPQVAAYVAGERVLRGEHLDGDERAHPEFLELPLTLAPWEPTYALATFYSDHVEVAEPWEPRAATEEEDLRSADVLDEPGMVSALLDLVAPWTSESNGAAQAVVVEGDAVAAASALTLHTLRIGPLTFDEAIQRMACGGRWRPTGRGSGPRRRAILRVGDGRAGGRRAVAAGSRRAGARRRVPSVVPVGRGRAGKGLGPADRGRRSRARVGRRPRRNRFARRRRGFLGG